MPRFAANISTMFREFPFLQRFSEVVKAGFKAVECQFPYEAQPQELQEALKNSGLEHLLINTPPGDFQKGERGMAAIPGREKEFKETFTQALEYAEALDCPYIHVMSGVEDKAFSLQQHEEVLIENLQHAAEKAAAQQRKVLIEPINNFDTPGYFMNQPDQGVSILQKVNLPNVRLQFDFYHTQVMVGHLEYYLRKHFSYIEHVQISGMPKRQEPDQGEIFYPYLYDLLDRLNYLGWVGCEYTPQGDTHEGLAWFRNLNP